MLSGPLSLSPSRGLRPTSVELFCAGVPARPRVEPCCANLGPAAFPSGGWGVAKIPFPQPLKTSPSHSLMHFSQGQRG